MMTFYGLHYRDFFNTKFFQNRDIFRFFSVSITNPVLLLVCIKSWLSYPCWSIETGWLFMKTNNSFKNDI